MREPEGPDDSGKPEIRVTHGNRNSGDSGNTDFRVTPRTRSLVSGGCENPEFRLSQRKRISELFRDPGVLNDSGNKDFRATAGTRFSR